MEFVCDCNALLLVRGNLVETGNFQEGTEEAAWEEQYKASMNRRGIIYINIDYAFRKVRNKLCLGLLFLFTF